MKLRQLFATVALSALLWIIFYALAVMILSGCATPPTPDQQYTPPPVEYSKS